MNELREKIIAALYADQGYRGLEHERVADLILAIPQIAEALALKAEIDRLKLGHTT